MTESTLRKKEMKANGTINQSKSGIDRKTWQSPELTEVDYEKTNAGYSGSGTDFGTYS